MKTIFHLLLEDFDSPLWNFYNPRHLFARLTNLPTPPVTAFRILLPL